jgi:hypothetical protein
MIVTQYINAQLNIGLVSWQEAWLLNKPYPQKLFTEHYRGAIVYRIPCTSRRIAYKKLKKNLQRKRIVIAEEPLPF